VLCKIKAGRSTSRPSQSREVVQRCYTDTKIHQGLLDEQKRQSHASQKGCRLLSELLHDNQNTKPHKLTS